MRRRIRTRSARAIGLLPRLGRSLAASARWLIRHPQPLILAALLAALAWLLSAYAQRVEAFRITQVVLPSDSSLTMRQPLIGENLWRVNLQTVADELKKQQPWWKEIRVIRQLPNTIRVEPIPRVPVAQVRLEQWHPVDAEGFILPQGQAAAATRWVKLTGLEHAAAPLRAGRLNTDERLRLALRVLATLRHARPLASHQLTELNVADPRQLRFVLDDQLQVRCGAEAELAAHLERLRAAFNAMRRHPLAAGYIDVRFREPVVSPRM